VETANDSPYNATTETTSTATGAQPIARSKQNTHAMVEAPVAKTAAQSSSQKNCNCSKPAKLTYTARLSST